MNLFKEKVDLYDNAALDIVQAEFKPIAEVTGKLERYFERLSVYVDNFKKDGKIPKLEAILDWKGVETTNATTTENETISQKENIEPLENSTDEAPRTRSRRNAFKEATQSINNQSKLNSNLKLRRPTNCEPLENAYVKLEKLSICDTTSETSEIKIKSEAEEMPAPTRPAPRRKKRKMSKVQVKQEKVEVKTERFSDIEIKEPSIPVVNLVDSLDENDQTLKVNEEQNKRVTRSSKRSRLISEDEEIETNEKRPKSINNNEQDKFEEASTTIDQTCVQNATFVAKPAENTLVNSTIVVEHPKYLVAPQTVEDLMTDDESIEDKQKSPPKPSTIPKSTKPIFSPFEQSPVKKRVAAFEKLQQEANTLPTRTTRTKTRAQAKQQESDNEPEAPPEKTKATARTQLELKSNVKEKTHIFTPKGSCFIPKMASTAVKAPRVHHDVSQSAPKTINTSKAVDALKKRDARLQAETEERRRKREEKQLKAQQQREALEKEKLKALEAQKLKDQRHKQLIQEKEESKQKQKEELERKRLMAKKRALEEKKKEEERLRLEEEKKKEEEEKKKDEEEKKKREEKKMQEKVAALKSTKPMPEYMKRRAPRLPTVDCYDSDEEEYKERVALPAWSLTENLKHKQSCAFTAGDQVKNTFFFMEPQFPDLRDIFEGIEAQKLQRSSSAIWHKPPRFTMIPGLESHDETLEYYDEN